MAGIQWLVEIALLGLLAGTLFHAVRLERALGVLKRDRAALEELVSGFNASTRQAEAGIERLRAAADGAGRQIARQVEAAGSLKEDLMFLVDRGERLADRIDTLVRAARPLVGEPPLSQPSVGTSADIARPVRSQAERDLLKALRMPR
jgi:hypothetical protein